MINTAGAASPFGTDGHRCIPFSQPLMNILCCCCSRSLASSCIKMLSPQQSESNLCYCLEVIITHPEWAKTLSNFLVNLTFVFSLLSFTHTFFFFFTPFSFSANCSVSNVVLLIIHKGASTSWFRYINGVLKMISWVYWIMHFWIINKNRVKVCIIIW